VGRKSQKQPTPVAGNNTYGKSQFNLRRLKSMKSCLKIAAIGFALVISRTLLATVTLPHVFGDNMVLQRDKPVPVWGTAAPGEKIVVGFGGQSKSCTAGSDGQWSVTLDPLKTSSTPAEMAVSGTNALKYENVLVGEVWLCSGQSNMEKPFGFSSVTADAHDQAVPAEFHAELAAANFPLIRILNVRRDRKPIRLRDANVVWTPCSGDTLISQHFSQVAYFFGRKLHHDLQVPIGLVEASFGGSPIEPWIPSEGFALAPSLNDFAQAAGKPWVKGTPQLSMMFNSMIAPFIPYAIRGVLWYQGESNVGTAANVGRYADEMFALIESWRSEWHDDFSFYYVEIAPFTYFDNGRPGPKEADSPDREALFWEQQTDALQIPHTGMIVTTDITDDVHNHHPLDKQSVGERLAAWTLAKDYGFSDVVFSGPKFKNMEIKGHAAIISFDYVDGGLMSRDGKPLTWLTIAGADGKFVPATATIEGDKVVVTSPDVPAPTTVRFAWGESAMPNLSNKAGLPALPFRTNAAPWQIPAQPP
jgi:sialate O-acetylesterase